MNENLIALAIQETPAVIAAFKSAFKKQNPKAVPPTDAEVATAYVNAFTSSLAKDDRWLAAHPE